MGLLKASSIVRDPEIQGGRPVYHGTRVPVDDLFDYLETGETLETFLDAFPSVKREVAIRVLEELRSIVSA